MSHSTMLMWVAYHWHRGLDSFEIAKLRGISEASVVDALVEIRARNSRVSAAAMEDANLKPTAMRA